MHGQTYNLPVGLKAFKDLRRKRGLSTPKATELEAYAIQQAVACTAKVQHQLKGWSEFPRRVGKLQIRNSLWKVAHFHLH